MGLILKAVIFLPLFSSILNGLLCHKITNRTAGLISTGAITVSALCALIIFVKAGINKEVINILVASWIKVKPLSVNWSIYVDQLTAIMFVLVTSVSAVVHIYSLGYMSSDKNLHKFLSYLSLFTFFMLALVSSDNFLQLFFGWEGVGLCSYLLIGYYYDKESANLAAIKAFIVNRVGDFAFIIGIVMIIVYTKSVNFDMVFALSENLSNSFVTILGVKFAVLDLICFLLFMGCMGKSAQIGMHVWLPDAMEGPTPVSALIHAATMVTAGIFLVARCSFMFEYSPNVLQIITIVGAITCLFAALVAITQNDIKKIIAYSTCSQLGYMFFACGVSAYQVGMFHLVTHGFFKALLFLSAGSVIHATHEQDIFKMGGLRTKMPITYANFWIGSLAIIGIYPFSGFYSKDLILESAYAHGGVGFFAFTFGIIAAFFTAVYSLKIIILTFHGSTKLTKEAYGHVHESEKIMNIPLALLSAGTLFSGMIGYYLFGISDYYGLFSGSIFNLSGKAHSHVPIIVQLLPLIIGVSASLFGAYVYRNKLYLAIADKLGMSYNLLKNKFYFDELFEILFVRPVRVLSSMLCMFDKRVIDYFGPSGFSKATAYFGLLISKLQTGYIFNYAFYMVFSIIICITVFVGKYLLYGIGV